MDTNYEHVYPVLLIWGFTSTYAFCQYFQAIDRMVWANDKLFVHWYWSVMQKLVDTQNAKCSPLSKNPWNKNFRKKFQNRTNAHLDKINFYDSRRPGNKKTIHLVICLRFVGSEKFFSNQHSKFFSSWLDSFVYIIDGPQ